MQTEQPEQLTQAEAEAVLVGSQAVQVKAQQAVPVL